MRVQLQGHVHRARVIAGICARGWSAKVRLRRSAYFRRVREYPTRTDSADLHSKAAGSAQVSGEETRDRAAVNRSFSPPLNSSLNSLSQLPWSTGVGWVGPKNSDAEVRSLLRLVENLLSSAPLPLRHSCPLSLSVFPASVPISPHRYVHSASPIPP